MGQSIKSNSQLKMSYQDKNCFKKLVIFVNLKSLFIYISLPCLIFLASCGSSPQDKALGNETDKEFKNFANFPNQPIDFIDYQLTDAENFQTIDSYGFKSYDENVFKHKNDSITFWFEEDLSDFTLKLEQNYFVKNSTLFYSFLSENATSKVGTEQFTEFNFSAKFNFSLTYFKTPNYIRLSYKLKK